MVDDDDDFALRVKTVLDLSCPANTFRYYKTITEDEGRIQFTISKERQFPSESWDEPEWYTIDRDTKRQSVK